jgi:hypothetical protein
VIDRESFLYFTERAVDGMMAIVTELGDDLANTRPPLAGANSPYVILVHCLGVMDYWAGHVVAGRLVERNRNEEFRASGSVADLLTRVEEAKAQLRRDLLMAEPEAPVRFEPSRSFLGPERPLTQGDALQHVYEELSQHHGHMEITRDVLKAGLTRPE